jgi:cytochrome c5
MTMHTNLSGRKTASFLAAVVLGAFLLTGSNGASGQSKERSGKDVVDSLCISCHTTGAGGAPKIGDKNAWAKRASQGLSSLTRSALNGVRQMPPHGGNLQLTDVEIERAITYMVNQSGGNWTEPISTTTKPTERTGEQIVQARCVKCHGTGEGGAPKIGDREAWTSRVRQGLDNVVRSAIKGHGAMPARGGQADLTDAEMRKAVIYMFNSAVPPAPAASGTGAALPAKSDRTHRVVEGMVIELGVVSAATIRAQHPKADPESTMHGGIPTGAAYYHVNVSLRDSSTNAPIEGADVEARVANPITGEQTKTLEPIKMGGVTSYGNYFRMPGKENYTIAVQVLRGSAAAPVNARFDFKHD